MSMRIIVGSKNPEKVNAVKEVIVRYDFLKNGQVESMEVESGINDQPKSLDEIIQGARNRAKNAYQDCDLSFGIESGFMEVLHTKTGWMELSACAIYDGKEFHLALSPAFECPPQVMNLIHRGKDLSTAIYKLGFHPNPNIGAHGGALGLFTKGRMDRKAYTKHAITLALIHLDNVDFYKK